MATLPMQKIRLMIHRDHIAPVLERVQKRGVVEFTQPQVDLDREEQTDFDANYEAGRLDTAIAFLERYEPVGTVSKILEGTAVRTNAASIETTARTFAYGPIVDRVRELETQINETNHRLQELREDEHILYNWQRLGISLDAPRETETTDIWLLSVTPDQDEPFFEALRNELGDCWAHEAAGETATLLITRTHHRGAVERLITEYQIERVVLPHYRGTPQEALDTIAARRAELIENQETQEAEAASLVPYLPQLRMAADYMHWQKDRTETIYSHGHYTDRVVVFEGWCPARECDRLYREIDAITHAFELQYIEPARDEEPPVAIENGPALLPFESVTRLYGVPSARDLDPTLFLSGFFFISFGLCLTDVGYGIFLALVTGLILLLYRTQRGLSQLLWLLLLGGISSLIVGLFFGGYFGVSMEYMPQWAHSLQYFDPINAPLPFFYLTLVIGFIQIVAGLLLDIARQAKYVTLTDGILDNVPWLLLFTGLGLYVGDAFGVMAVDGAVWVIGLAVLSLLITQGRAKDGFLKKAFSGVMSLYGLVDYFSDVLSYSRLLALGLATSALAFSVNMIAALLQDMVPVIGPVIMVIMLVVGHTFNLVVNVLGAYIHTARLQFVEFFGKFLTGTGRTFAPLARDERNVILSER